MRLIGVVAAAIVTCLVAVSPGHAEKRVALVIGNSAYRNVAALPNPVNDASDVAAVLRGLGFEGTGQAGKEIPRLVRR